MTEVARHRVQGLAILLAALGLVALLVWRLASPVLELRARHQAVTERIARFEAAASRPVTRQIIDASELLFSGDSVEGLARRNQRLLVENAESAGLRLQRISQGPIEPLEHAKARVRFQGEFVGDLQAFEDYLGFLERRQPVFFIDRLEIKANDSGRPDIAMSIRIDLSTFYDLEASG